MCIRDSPDGETGEHPLIIYSHGFGGYRRDSTYLVEYLAANGYVVAAVDFPLSYKDSPAGVPQLEDVVNQAGDVQQVIDYILSMNSDSASVLHQRIDVNNIGAMGLSLGGLTTALASFHPDVKDDRIKAAVMMAPPLQMFSDKFFATNSMVKSLIISGSMDRVVPQKVHATEVQARHPQGWFLSFDKGTHLGFADIGNYIRWMENPDNLGCAFMNFMLSKIDLPSQWDEVIPNTNGVLRKVEAATPCPNIPGESMNGLKQQWLTNIAIASFFDMHLRSGPVSQQATDFFTDKLLTENAEVTLTVPQQ